MSSTRPPAPEAPPGLPPGRMRVAVGAGVLAAVALAVFAVQNGQHATVRFLAWSWEEVPLFAVILACLALGFILGGGFFAWRFRRPDPGRRRRWPL